MSAYKKVVLDGEMVMIPSCHPQNKMEVRYLSARGGDRIVVKCEFCYRIFIDIKLPSENTRKERKR